MDFLPLFPNANDSFFTKNQSVDDLPDLGSLFTVPALPDKPQNPIMDSLENIRPLPSPRIRTDTLPPELAILAATYAGPLVDRPLSVYELWSEASLSKRKPGNKALYWDRLCPDILLDKPSSTPFISEQDHMVYSVARHQLQSSSFDYSAVDRVYLNQNEFLSAVRTIVLGTSSIYYVWDAKKERFVYAKEGRQGYLIVDGKDMVICRSITRRFLTIGTLIRRLEVLLVTLRARSTHDGPTIYAFAHSMSTVLTYLREEISQCSTIVALQGQQLSAIYMRYSIYEDILTALSSFYGRGEDTLPEEYPHFESAPIQLLNHIYNELVLHMERQSHRIVIAIFAFTLTNTCRDYLREISSSVGYGMAYIKRSTRVVGERPDQYAMDEFEEEEQADDIFEIMEKLSTEYPSFFPPELVEVLPAAQKSLVLLQEAQPEHPLLIAPRGQKPIYWFWTENEIEAEWKQTLEEEKQGLRSLSFSPLDQPSSTSYKPELVEFRVFDLAPGSFVGSSALKSEDDALATFRAFIESFPERLPSITPTLPRLASLVFSKLVDHALQLSDALLTVFLSADSNLNLRAHLELLRSFLLVTLPAFESRLSSSLFSDAEEYELGSKRNGTSLYSLRRRKNKKYVPDMRPWAVGLAADLFDGDKWPPVGTDLGYLLRTVIVDSIGVGDKDQVRQEAEYRLGFAIRDLPAGSVKWMDPLSIEALDFLYMDYKPPRALEVLVTPDILSKYQRMFAFILRLMRVTHAVRAVHRMSRSSSRPLFETLVKFRKLMHHFRFVAQSFVSNLSAYIFDTAIGGNFDSFLERLAATATAASSAPTSISCLASVPVTERFSDIFSLSQNHSELLDNILSACLLRSGQREVGDILRQSLEAVLEFSVVIGELHRGRLKEYQAGPMVEDLFAKFRGKMMMLTRVLKELAEKTGAARISAEERHEVKRRATGGMEALGHLMLRLEMGGWWSSGGR